MDILWWNKYSPLVIDNFLVEEQASVMREDRHLSKQDLIVVYEPLEAFSYNVAERDMRSIRNPDAFYGYLARTGVPLVKTHRGGGMIWHGPGQICLAPVVNVEKLRIDTTTYSSILEEACLATIVHFGIQAQRNRYISGAQGVWVRDPQDGTLKKLAFFGWSQRRGIAIHGCAINVRPDLYPFSLIDPCNLPGIQVTSMAELLSEVPDVFTVGMELTRNFTELIEKHKQKAV